MTKLKAHVYFKRILYCKAWKRLMRKVVTVRSKQTPESDTVVH